MALPGVRGHRVGPGIVRHWYSDVQRLTVATLR